MIKTDEIELQIQKYIEFCLKSNFVVYPSYDLKNYIEVSLNEALFDANSKYKVKGISFNKNKFLDLLQTEPTIEAVFFYRLQRNIFLKDPSNTILPYLASVMRRRTHCEIYYSTDIGPGFNIQHGFGIVIGPRYKIGKNFIIHQGVTLGQKNVNNPDETINIGDNVVLFSGVTIVGDITIGNNSLIGANSVLLKNVESNSTYAGIPAKKIK